MHSPRDPWPEEGTMLVNPILQQHRTIEYLFGELQSDGHRRDSLRLRLLGDLTAHISAELYVFYPAVGRALPTHLEHDAKLLRRARELLLAQGAQFREGLDELAALFARHVEEQERDLLPTCDATLDETRLAAVLDDVARFTFRLSASPRREWAPGDSPDLP